MSAYFWCSEGTSQQNLMLLQSIAQHVRQLHCLCILATDFNFPFQVLEDTGWLLLVGGPIVCIGQATCREVEDDYFAGDARLRGAIVGIASIQ